MGDRRGRYDAGEQRKGERVFSNECSPIDGMH